MIRAISALDTSALEAIHRAAFGTSGWSAQVIMGQLQVSGTSGLIHDEGGMILARSVVDEAEILTLAVVPEARRRGIGGQILAFALKQAVDNGCKTMFLEVSAANVAARALYGAHGFVSVGMRPRYYEDGADALVMRAVLNQASRGGVGPSP